MQQPLQQYNILLWGAHGSGRSALATQFVCCCFVDQYDPVVEEPLRKNFLVDDEMAMLYLFDYTGSYHDEYAQPIEQWTREADVILILHPWNDNRMEEEVRGSLEWIRRVRRTDDKVLPCFVVATKTDLRAERAVVTREQFVGVAAQYGAAGYYEVSSRFRINIDETFADAVRWVRKKRRSTVEQENAKKQLSKLSGPVGLLPWNWSKKAEWNSKVKCLNFASANVSIVISEKEIVNFRLPEPTVTKNPVAFYKDIAQLLDSPEGKDCSDLWLQAENSTERFYAHRIIVSLRSEYLRQRVQQVTAGAVVEVEGVASNDVMREVLRFLYSNTLPESLSKESLSELLHASNAIGCGALKMAATEALRTKGGTARIIESSEAVQKEMQPALMDFASLSNVQIVVEKQTFRLHRAIICARCKWLQVLLAERWRKGDNKPLELSSFSADVFGTVVEFLYTGRARITGKTAVDILAAADLLGLPRLTQLAEIALQSVIDGSNAVPVYLAAEHHRARQLMATCLYWMGVELDEATKHKQWAELSEEVQDRVRGEHAKLIARREQMKTQRVLSKQLPCVFANL